MRPLAIASLFVLGCGGPMNTTAAPDGCPPANLVALAQWNPRTVVGSPPYRGAPKDATWLVRLGYRPDGADDAPAPGPVEGYQVAKLGLGPLPDPVWLLRPGVAPCPSHVTGYVSERVDDGPISFRISAVLAGCPAPADDDIAPIAWISFAGVEPTGCRIETPTRIGERAGVVGDDGRFTIPPLTAATTLPPIWDTVVPPEPCERCETRWSIDTIAGADPTISAVAITDVLPGATQACELEYHDSYGLYATPKGGTPARLALIELDLVGALVDARGTRAVLATGVDTWAAYDVGADGAIGAGRLAQYFEANEEDSLWHSLAPYCAP